MAESKSEDDPSAQNGIVIWTISGDIKEVIPNPAAKPPEALQQIPKKKLMSSSGHNSSTGSFELSEDPIQMGQAEDPGNVCGRIAYSILMMLVGIALIIVGVISELKSTVPGGGVPFWVIGSLLVIPGLYCTWDSISTYRQLQMTERQHIFKDEPVEE